MIATGADVDHGHDDDGDGDDHAAHGDDDHEPDDDSDGEDISQERTTPLDCIKNNPLSL